MADAGAQLTSPFLAVSELPDGTVTRPPIPLLPPNSTSTLLIKDIPLNPTTGTSLRLYLPAAAAAATTNTKSYKKLPTLLYIHGGCFVIFKAATSIYDQFCTTLAATLPALVISLDYRLAPEHRLPAAYDDTVDALRFLRSTKEPWIVDHADLDSTFIVGTSSGANMAVRAALSAADAGLPKLAGLVLNQPYYGGVERTPSEARSENDVLLPLGANDYMWRLALPEGADRDHPFCNPLAAPVEGVERLPRCLVKGVGWDPLLDRQKAFAAMLAAKGVNVEASFDEDGIHAVELLDAGRQKLLVDEIKIFVERTTGLMQLKSNYLKSNI